MQRPAKSGVGHRIEIAGPAAEVWAVIADLEHWGNWNPLYIRVSGEAVVGTPLDMTIQLEGMKPQQARAAVVTVRPEACLEYGISNLGGLVKAFRYIDLVPLDEGRCEVSNGEIMSGLLGNMLAGVVGEKVRQGLTAMNEALKARVEG